MNDEATYSESAWLEDDSAALASDGRWTDVELLHESGSGTSAVYRAKRHGKWHVLKVLKEEYRNNPIAQVQQRKEFEIGYTLSHPNIAAVTGLEEVPGLGQCIIEEWVDGIALREVMRRDDFSAAEVRNIIAQILDTLDYIHNRQVIHRDLKPSNIMVTASGNRVKLIDFGVSDTSSHTILKGPAGTRRYAAPEMFDGEMIDNRVDLYSLGVIAGEMNNALPRRDRSLKRLAQACCKENPDERPATAAEARAIFNHRSHRWAWLAAAIVIAMIIAVFMVLRNNDKEAAVANPPNTIAVVQPEATVDTPITTTPSEPIQVTSQPSQNVVSAPIPVATEKPQDSSSSLPPSFRQDVLAFAHNEALKLATERRSILEKIDRANGPKETPSIIITCKRFIIDIEKQVEEQVLTNYSSNAMRNYMATDEGQQLLSEARSETRKTVISLASEQFPNLAIIFNDMKIR